MEVLHVAKTNMYVCWTWHLAVQALPVSASILCTMRAAQDLCLHLETSEYIPVAPAYRGPNW